MVNINFLHYEPPYNDLRLNVTRPALAARSGIGLSATLRPEKTARLRACGVNEARRFSFPLPATQAARALDRFSLAMRSLLLGPLPTDPIPLRLV